MRRREFITLLGGATAWPLAARAQQPARTFRIGVLGPALTSPPPIRHYRAFLTELREFGLMDGTNLAVEYRPQDDPRGTFAVAADLLRSRPELIVVSGGEHGLQAVVGASIAVPVVMIAVNYDPVERGYVESLARPGGNITGVMFRQVEFVGKNVELLAETFPRRTRLAAVFDAQTADLFGVAEQAAKTLGMQVQPINLERLPYDFDAAFRSASASGAEMALVLSSIIFTRYRDEIARFAMQHRLPTMFVAKHYVDAGGLMSFGVDFTSMFRKAATYVGRILRGAKPVELPVERATRFEMVVNLNTAKALGLDMPPSLLVRADEVIE
jgi:putative ABC transport system substrate-binding protein